MPKLQIILDSSNNAFFANTTVHGKIKLETKKPIKARTFVVTILGYAKTNWIHEIKINKTRAEYKTLKFFIQKQILLWQSSADMEKIPAGNHIFPFEFFIPYDSPPNLANTNYGNICYTIEAEINIPWSFNNKSQKIDFSVSPLIDLNDKGSQLASLATSFTDSNPSNKFVKLSILIPKVGYVCGEKIPLKIGIENKSSSKITSIETGIEAIYTFSGECENPPPTASKMDTKTFSKIFNLPKIKILLQKNEKIEMLQNIEIPSFPPSYDACGFIKIHYQVFAKVHTNAIFSGSTSVFLPFIIGNVPLQIGLFKNSYVLPSDCKIVVRNDGDVYDASQYYISPPPPSSSYSMMANMHFENVEFRELKVEGNSKIDYYGFQPKFPYFLKINNNEKD